LSLPQKSSFQTVVQEGAQQAGGPESPLKDAIAGYQRDRDTLEKKDEDTCKREDSGLKMWLKAFCERPVCKVDAKLFKDYAVWRKLDAKGRNRRCSGHLRNQHSQEMAKKVRC
jgi:hypothetical protein